MQMTIRDVMKQAKLALTAMDVEVLLAHVLSKPRSYLLAHPDALLNSTQYEQFSRLIARKTEGEPTAYLTGFREFWSQDLEVTAETLIPRPETELLVEQILKT